MDSSLKPSSHSLAPSTTHMIHERIGHRKNPQNTQSLAQPHLECLQMTWEADVEDVYPIIGTPIFMFMKEFPNPHKLVFTTLLVDPDELIAALKTALKSWSILRSIAVEYDQATRLVVVLRATQRYFDRAITIHTDVEDDQALVGISVSGDHAASELPRGLMFRIVVARVKSTKTVGMIIVVNHAIMDAVVLNTLRKDVEALITGVGVPKMIPYKAFAEAYYLHQTSLAAKMATDYHVERLRGIGTMHRALWPPTDLFQSVRIRPGVPNETGKIEAIEGGGYSNAQVVRYRRCPNLVAISKRPSTIVNAAIAIFNTSITSSKHAIFGTLLAGREWPFINESLARLLPNPMSIAGPTLTGAVIVVRVDDTEPISTLLGRLEAEQRLLRRHQHVPPDFPAHLDDADREMWILAQQRQYFNYHPNHTGLENSASADAPLRLISETEYKVDRSHNVFVWECGLRDSETLRIRAMFNPDMFSAGQVIRFTESVFDIVDFLSDPDNWGKEVRELRAILSKRGSRL